MSLMRNPGFWGQPTSTIDWCEENYLVTDFIAEFFNSTTSLFITAAGALPLVLHVELWPVLETRFLIAFLSIIVVGLGSVAFHGTLLFEHQMLDEVPMLWTVVVLVYCLLEQSYKEPHYGQWLPCCLAVYASVATYATSQQGGSMQWWSFHTFFAIAEIYGLYMVVKFFRSIDDAQKSLRALMMRGFAAYILAIVVWQTDLNFCHHLQKLPGYDYWNLHAWGWHFLVSWGLHAMVVGIWYHRLRCVCGVNVRLGGVLLPRLELCKET
eukprot:TRINITY_DN38674_c0_g2_i1.p1 TRINITY_DN38674_c0_g2~~TRINITY_DN38674_c0_g2_i1.p1  ORF type:complete len:267 (-),score=41.49 TRINITY_DN38674_c0_g2_i1:50-850(-)